MDKTIKNILGVCVVLLFSFILLSRIYAASSDFLQKATAFYQSNCTQGNIPRPTAILCYLYDKTAEHDQLLNTLSQAQINQTQTITNLSSTVSTQSGQINSLKNKSILDYGQYRGADYTSDSLTDAATDTKVDITCPINCALVINYVVDTRNSQSGTNNIYTIYLDGINQSFVNQASYTVGGQAVPLSLTGIVPANSGNHTVQIYARTTGGQLEEHTKTLTVMAIGQ